MPNRPHDKDEVLQHPFSIKDAILQLMGKLRGFVNRVDSAMITPLCRKAVEIGKRVYQNCVRTVRMQILPDSQGEDLGTGSRALPSLTGELHHSRAQ